MKALVYTQPYTVAYMDQAEPEVQPGEAIVEVAAAGICGSDMHAFHGHDPRRNPPLVLGHEVAGRCISGRNTGRPVVLNPLISCFECEYCEQGRFNLCPNRTMIGMTRAGAFADRVSIPERNVIPLPEGMDMLDAALTEPTATALHGLALVARSHPRPLAEAAAAVIGGGAIGLISALLLRAYGNVQPLLSEPNTLRRDGAKRAGIGNLHDPGATALAENAFDLVIDAVGSAATRQAALAAVRPGGTVLLVGLLAGSGEIDARKLTLGEITLIGCYTYTPADVRASVNALADGTLGDLAWVEQRSLADGARAFQELDRGEVAAAKVILTPAMSS